MAEQAHKDAEHTPRRALVCGASAGIGFATAVALAHGGYQVIALARRAHRLKALQDHISHDHLPAPRVLVADLNDLDSAVATVRSEIDSGGPIHVLINNTGGPESGAILEAQPQAFLEGISGHVLAAHALTQLLLPGMRKAGWGRIVNVISTSVREPIANLGVSNTVRGAMASWAKSVSRELPPGITINNVLPGFTDTERLDALREATALREHVSEDQVQNRWLAAVPEGRLARPQEIAAAVAFLASDAASYIRGISLPVDGGRMASL